MTSIEYIINLVSKDHASGVLRIVDSNVNKLDTHVKNLSTSMGTGLRSAFMSLPGAGFFTNPIVAISAGIGVVSKLGMQTDITKKSFDVLCGSEKKAADLLEQIKQFADKSPYERSDIIENTKVLMGFNIEQKKAFSDMKRLADIAMGDKNKLSLLTLPFAQATALGKLQSQDWHQFVSAGWNPLADISQLTGKSIGKLQEMMGKGQISSDLLSAALVHATSVGGKYYNMVATLGNTESGQWATLMGQTKTVLVGLYRVIQPFLMPTFKALGDLFKKMEPLTQSLANGVAYLKDKFEKYSTSIYILIGTFAAAKIAIIGYTIATKGFLAVNFIFRGAIMALTAAQWLWNVAMNANPIGLIVAGIGILASIVMTCWTKFAGFRAVVLTSWDAIKGFGTVLKDFVIDRIKSIISGLGSMGAAISSLFKGNFKEAFDYAKKGIRDLSGIDAKSKLIKSTAKVFGGIKNDYNKNLSEQQKKDNPSKLKQATDSKINDPKTVGTIDLGAGFLGGNKKKKKGKKGDSESLVSGGSRITHIQIHIGKFFDAMNVTMMNATDTRKLEAVVVECMNRALETGYSAVRG